MINIGNLDPAKMEPILREKIQKRLLALAYEIAGRAAAGAPSGANRRLAGSIVAVPIGTAGMIGYSVGTPLTYGRYVEFGTRPHWAPIEALANWVEQKIQPHVLSVGVKYQSNVRTRVTKTLPTGRSTQLRGKSRRRAVMNIAYAIQRKIAMKGTRPNPFLERALQSLGVPYTIHKGLGDWSYHVDIVNWLGRDTSFWRDIESGLAR